MTPSASPWARRLVVALGVLVAGLAGIPDGAHAEAPTWKEIERAFDDTWRIDGEEDAGLRSKLRGQKREAAKLLRGSNDARAVPLLLGAHKKQLRFIEKLRKGWAERKQKWEKLAPAMRQSIGEKQRIAGPGNPIPATSGEREWIDEGDRLETLFREISNEEEIAEYVRKAAARVVDTLEGDERARALRDLLGAAGKGQDEVELEFVRVLGSVAGDDVTEALEKYASSTLPFTVQAALEALGRQNAPRSVDTLLGRLDDPRWQVRVAALQGLVFYRDVRVVEALLERLPQEDGVLQRHYFTALCRIFGESVTGTVEAFVSWWAGNKEAVAERWAAGQREGPVLDDPPPIMVVGEGQGGSTSFYGIETQSKHIIFVIDVSGSMGEQGGKNEEGLFRIDVAKRELTNAIRSLSAEDRDARGESSFNVVAYAADVHVFKTGRMLPATKRNKDKAFAWIEKLDADGATNIHDALEQAFDIIGTRKVAKQYEEGADTIFLMTDGKPTAGKVMDPVLIRAEIQKLNRDRKITIHAIGVGEGHDASFLRSLATENNGTYLAR